MIGRVRGILAFGLIALAGCSRHEPREQVASSSQRVTSGPCTFTAPPTGGTFTNVTFTVKTPQGVAPSELALGTDLGSLRQGNGVRLLKDSGGFASLSSVEATARLAIGNDAEAQSAYSELTGIDVGARAHLHGSVKTASTLNRGANVQIDGTISQNTSLRPLAALTWNVAFPSLHRGSCALEPDLIQTIDPGSYGNISVKPRSHLKLRAGTYYFTSLALEPMAVLDVDNASGPVFVNVKNAFTWGGSVVETAATKGNVVFSLATTAAVTLTTAMRGIVVAPSASLTLGASTSHFGSFFARTLEAQANATVRQRPLSSAAVCPGATDCSALCPCGSGGSCKSNNECQSGLSCQAQVGGGSVCAPVNVDDGNPCTADSLSGTTPVHTPLPPGTSCADANACNGAETCNASASCVAGTPPAVDDGNPCTTDACNPASGVAHTPVAAGTSCADANACNGAETCNGSAVCLGGTPPSVNDGNPCTTDSCSPATGVVHTPVAAGTSCSDGNACNGAEACNASASCGAGTPVTCVATDQCHVAGTCEPTTGVCSNPAQPNGSACSDGDACTALDTCQSGACSPGSLVATDDNNPCTADSCNPTTGVIHVAVAAGTSCSDADACNGAETCNGSASCVAGIPPVVDDDNPCTADSCSPATGVVHTPVAAGTSCADANACNGAETCNGSASCVAGLPPSVDDGNACTSDACDPVAGITHTAVSAGSSCSNGDVCDGDETCNATGVCLPGTPLSLDDGDPCTSDACDPLAGVSHPPAPSGTICEDDDLCTSGDTCDGEGFCVAGSGVPADDDGDPCTLRYCDPETGVRTVTCTPVEDSTVTTVDKAYAFLYTGPGAPQTGVAAGAIAPLRAALVSGRVLDLDGDGISGVSVRILDAPELGATTTRTDGSYDLVVNGGGSLVVDFAADGYLRAQRRVSAEWGGFSGTPDVVLVGLDPEVTTITAGAPVFQVASGSTSTDADGSRRATVMFPPGTSATMKLPDGTLVPLEDFDVRATEFTVGERGEEAMPGELPPTSGYTYAAELSVDAALAAGASRVDFDQDLPLYLENFLNIPDGTSVPAGFYDRELGKWVPSDNGVVLRIVGIADGAASIDANGDGSADSEAALAALGIGMGERLELGSRYAIGASLWRVPIRHFTPWDCNYPFGPQPGDCGPSEECGGTPEPTPPAPDPTPCEANGSIIECTNQILRERLPVSGTPFTLDYSSDRTPGFLAGNALRIPVTGPTPLPSSARSTELEISIAGRKFTQTFSTAPNQSFTFVWDGKDALGRRLQGAQKATVRRGYTYDAVYMKPAQFKQAFAQVSGFQLTGNRARGQFTLSTVTEHSISGYDARRAFAFGGLGLSVHHAYDPRLHTLLRGNGEEENPSFLFGNVIGTSAGTGTAGLGADGVPATASALSAPAGVAAAPDGTLYLADTGNRRVRRVNADGTVDTVVGGVPPSTPDLVQNGGNELAIPAVNQIPSWTAVSGGAWTTRTASPPPFAGANYFFAGVAAVAELRQDVNVASFAPSIDAGGQAFAFEGYVRSFDQAPLDQSRIIVEYRNAANTVVLATFDSSNIAQSAVWLRVADLRPAPVGTRTIRIRLIATRAAGSNNDGYFDAISLRAVDLGDGGPADTAILQDPRGLAVGADGSLFIADGAGNRVRRIDAAGDIHTVAGTGAPGSGGDDGDATLSLLANPTSVAVAPDGTLYIADTNNHRVRQVSTSGVISTLAGTGTPGSDGNGAPAGTARLNQPQGVAVQPDGSVLIADTGNHQLRRVGVDGVIRRVAGTGTPGSTGDGGLATLALLNRPSGVLAAADGRIFIADEVNHRLRLIAPGGRITTVAGTGTAGSSGDNGPSAAAQLNAPDAAALAPDGSIYVAERAGHRVRRLDAPLPELSLGEISVPSADGKEVFVFTGDGRHLRTRHALTGATRYEFGYDAADRLQSIRDFDGNLTSIERNASGQATAIVGPFGQRTVLEYATSGYLHRVRDPLGSEVSLELDALGLLTGLRDQRGFDHSFDYDPLGRVVFDGDPAGGSQVLLRTEDSTGVRVTRTTALGRSELYDLHTLAGGGTQRAVTRPSGLTNTSTTLPNGTASATYSEGTVTQSTATSDPRFGVVTPLVSAVTRTPSGLTHTSTRARSVVLSDPKNPFSLVSTTDTLTQNGRVTTTSYDAATRKFTSTSPAGRSTTRTIDALGRTLVTQAAGILPTTSHYDAAGRLDSITQGTRSTVMTYQASGAAAGYPATVRRSPTDLVSYARDALGRVLQETQGTGTMTFAWDPSDNLSSATPPGQSSHDLHYTPVDLLESYAPPAAGLPVSATSYTYDVDQQLRTETRPDGTELVTTPDSAGRVDSVAIPGGLVDYAYYPAGTPSGAGKLSDVRGPYGVDLHFTYDGTLVTGMTWSGDVVGGLSLTYNNDFKAILERVSGATGSAQAAFGYDADLLVTCASPTTCNPAGADALRLTRSPQNGLVTALTLGSTSETLSYNGLGELARQTATFSPSSPLLDITYDAAGVERDQLGRVVQKREVSDGVTNTYRYTYNAERRLTDVTVNAVLAEHFEYDVNGNRTLGFDAATGATSTGTYDAQDRQASYGPFDFTYTANGELATKTNRETGDEWVFDYDALGNLLSAALPNGDLIEYLVDGTGRRVGKSRNGVLQKRWLYRDALNPVAELDGSGALVSEFVYASKQDTPDYVRRGGATYRVISDQLGSPRLVVNVANASDVPFRATYTSFGEVTGTGLDWMPLGFAGGIFDADTRLVRFGARDYSPGIGRWLTKDPERFRAPGGNFYAYCSGDPVNHTDPSGLAPHTAREDGAFIECETRILICAIVCGVPEPLEALGCVLCTADLFDPNGACAEHVGSPDPPPPVPPCPPGQVPGRMFEEVCIPDPDFRPNACEPEAGCNPATSSCPPQPRPLPL